MQTYATWPAASVIDAPPPVAQCVSPAGSWATVGLEPSAPGAPGWPFWFHVICDSRVVQWLSSELLGPDGSISRIVPVAFSLHAV